MLNLTTKAKSVQEQFELEQIKALKEKCAKYKVKFTAYVIMRGFRTLGTRDYGVSFLSCLAFNVLMPVVKAMGVSGHPRKQGH